MKNLGNVFILGDSYSTFKGCIPKEYAYYYDENCMQTFGFNDKDCTWWNLLLEKTNSNLSFNDSYSGTTICYTGYDGADAKQSSMLYRLKKYIENDYFNKNNVNTLFVFGGTNDSWANSPLGDKNNVHYSENDLYCFYPAIKELAKDIRENLSNLRIIFIINCELTDDVTNGILNVCKANGIQTIKLHDIQKVNGHPNKEGMEQICNQIYEQL